MPVETALLSVLPPMVISLVILLAAWRPWSKTPPPARWGLAGSALALAVAYAVTEPWLLHSFSGFPPSEHRWLPYLGLAAAVGAMLPWGKKEGRFGLETVIAAACFAVLRWDQITSKGTVVYGALWVVLATMIAGSIRSDGAGASKCGPRAPLTWLVASIGLSLVVFKESFQQSFLTGSICAVLGVFMVLTFWKRSWEIVPGLGSVLGVLYVGMVLCMGSTVESKVLVLCAVLSPGLAAVPAVAKLKPWQSTALCVLLSLALSVAAVWQSPGGFDFGME